MSSRTCKAFYTGRTPPSGCEADDADFSHGVYRSAPWQSWRSRACLPPISPDRSFRNLPNICKAALLRCGTPWPGPPNISGHGSIDTRPPPPDRPAPCNASPLIDPGRREDKRAFQGGGIWAEKYFMVRMMPQEIGPFTIRTNLPTPH